MKKLFTLLLALMATITLWAYDFQSGDLYYNITSSSEPYTVEVTYEEGWSSKNYSGLTTAVIPTSVTYNSTTYNVTSIGIEAFAFCRGLTSVIIPNSVTSIGDNAFYSCSGGLTAIVVENGNPHYDSRDNCNAIIETGSNTIIVGCKNTTIPNSVTSIGDGAFADCSGLTSITIPNSVTEIGDGAFCSCSGLTSITIPNSVTSIGDNAFRECSCLTTITIPNSVTSIGVWAFSSCDALTSITIPNSVTSIGSNTFSYCDGLTSVTLGNSITRIGEEAFWGCYRLTSIIIPNSVTSIGGGAFGDCSSLTFIKSLAEVPPTLGTYTFYDVSTQIPVYVPCSSVSAYQSAYRWKDFTNIQCMPEDESAVDNVHSQSPITNCQKILRDGHLLIIRDGVTYNAQGAVIN